MGLAFAVPYACIVYLCGRQLGLKSGDEVPITMLFMAPKVYLGKVYPYISPIHAATQWLQRVYLWNGSDFSDPLLM